MKRIERLTRFEPLFGQYQPWMDRPQSRIAASSVRICGEQGFAMMTPEETKDYIERRLRDLGWAARIDKTAYEKIYRFTDGTEAGANQICYKLLSLGSLQPHREVTDDLVSVALDDLARMDEIVKRSAKTAASADGEPDDVSIEQLAAQLAAKMSTGELPNEMWAPPRSESVSTATATAPRASADSKPGTTRSSPRRTPPPKTTTASAAAAAAPKPKPASERSPVVSSADRLAPQRTPGKPPFRASSSATPPRGSLMQRLYRFSSTATITFSATVLVVVALTMILFINRSTSNGRPAVVAAAAPQSLEAAPPVPPAEDTAPLESPDSKAPPSLSNGVPSERVAPAAPMKKDETAVAKEKESDRSAKLKPDTNGKSAVTEIPAGDDAKRLQPRTPVPDAPAPGVDRTRVLPPAPTDNKLSAPEAMASAAPPAPIPSVPPGNSNAAAEAPSSAAIERGVPAVRPRISKDELAALLRRFAFVYEAGDADQFVNLFSENARTNDKVTRQGIREDYEEFFGSTDVRHINLGQVNWEVEDNQAQGWGNFDVTVRRAGEQEVQAYSGSLSFYVEKVDGRLRIVRLYHGQRRAGL